MKPPLLIPQRSIPPERQTMYYVGLAMSVIGLLLFLSVFVSVLLTMAGMFQAIEDGPGAGFDRFRSVPWAFLRGFVGFVMMLCGGGMMGIAARGLAGSGVLLDPEQARRDMEPWNRMQGGMLSDALGEVDVVNRVVDRLDAGPPAEVVKVRCRHCQALNDEHDRFCGQCGQAL